MKKLPFYSRSLRAVVVDEMCECGRLKSEHGSKVYRIDDTLLRLPNEGNCGCECTKFTWARYVTVEEKAAIVLADRRYRKDTKSAPTGEAA